MWFTEAVGEGRDAALLEVFIHEGINNWIVEAVEEPNGLNYSDDHVQGDSIVLLLQIIWTITYTQAGKFKYSC